MRHLILEAPWQEDIQEALEVSAAVTVFVNPSSIHHWQNKELQIAIKNRLPIKHAGQRVFCVISVQFTCGQRSQALLPSLLSRTTWIDFGVRLKKVRAWCGPVPGT